MIEDRVITFGKYKGEPIKKLILTHLGYVMWCLSNMASFKLNDDEQQLYDMMAIAVLNSDVETSYPKEELKRFVKDTWSLSVTKKSPFKVTRDGTVSCDTKTMNKYRLGKYRRPREKELSLADLTGLHRQCSDEGFGRYYRDFDYDDYVEDALYEDYFH